MQHQISSHSTTVERIIEKCVSSSALIALALDQSAQSQIYKGRREAVCEAPGCNNTATRFDGDLLEFRCSAH